MLPECRQRITYISIYMNFWPYHKRVPTIGNTRHFWNLITQKLLESVYSFISVFSRVVVVGGGSSPVPFSWESIFRFRGRDTPMRGKVYDSTPVYLGTFYMHIQLSCLFLQDSCYKWTLWLVNLIYILDMKFFAFVRVIYFNLTYMPKVGWLKDIHLPQV